jgi:hypothetical protein
MSKRRKQMRRFLFALAAAALPFAPLAASAQNYIVRDYPEGSFAAPSPSSTLMIVKAPPALPHECGLSNAIPDMAVLDRNDDGRVSRAEFGFINSTNLSLFHSMDRNHDGYVTPGEIHAYSHVGDC